MFSHRLTRHGPRLLGWTLPTSAEALCPCWAAQELRNAVAALPEDPTSGDDAAVGRCEPSSFLLQGVGVCLLD
jgi:hypothetical protein